MSCEEGQQGRSLPPTSGSVGGGFNLGGVKFEQLSQFAKQQKCNSTMRAAGMSLECFMAELL